MSHKILSAALTTILLLLTGAVVFIAQIVALNGFSDRQGSVALGSSLVCQTAGIVLAAAVAARLSGWLVTKFNWHKAVSVIAAILAGTMLGGGFAVISTVLSLAVAEWMR